MPKSHRWDQSRHPNPEEASYAEMSIGEAFVFLGSTVHGGGTNTTNQSRVVHGFFFCRSWMRPEVRQRSSACYHLLQHQVATNGRIGEPIPMVVKRRDRDVVYGSPETGWVPSRQPIFRSL